jgi:hypothetical protein
MPACPLPTYRSTLSRLQCVLVLVAVLVTLLAGASPASAQASEEPTPDPTASAAPSPEASEEPSPEPSPSEDPSPDPAPEAQPAVQSPSIVSHKDDYLPGEGVVLLGERWQPGEAIHLFVNDDEGKTWSYGGDVTAAQDGSVRHEFFLPGWFVATYSVTATGGSSGTATTSFTDSIVSGPATTNQNGGTGGSSSSSLTIAKPTPLAVGDFMLAQVIFTHGADINNLVSPGGWTLVRRTDRGTDLGQAIFSKVATSSDAAAATLSYTWQFKKGSSLQAERAAGGITRYTGVDTSSPVVDSDGASGDSRSLTAPGVDAVSDTMLVGFFGIMKQTSLSIPSGMSERYFRQHSNSSGPTIKATEQVTSTSPTGSRTSTAGASEKWVAQLVALRPAATNTGPFATNPSFNPVSPKSSDALQAFSTITDADGNNVTARFVWAVTRSGNRCEVRTFTTSSASGAGAGSVHTDSLDLGTSHTTTTCTGANPGTVNPSKGDTIVLEATPNDGTADGATRTASVVVANSAPTATVSLDDASPRTNDTLTATATKADPDGDAVTLTFVWKVGGVTKQTTTTSSSLTDAFDLSAPGYGDKGDTIEVFVTPSDGTADGTTASDSATVGNSAPTVTLSGPFSVNEGETRSYSFAVSDPDGDGFTVSAHGCGTSGSAGSVAPNSSGGSFDCTFPDGPATTTVSVEVKDDEEAPGSDSLTVSVANVAPTVVLTAGPTTVDESGTDQRTYSYSISDPGDDAVQSTAVSCGVAGTVVSSSNTNDSGTIECIFDDGGPTPPGTDTTVTAQAMDSDLDTGQDATRLVNISNVAPTARLVASKTDVVIGQSVTLTGSATDPSNADTGAGFQWAFDEGSGFGAFGVSNTLTRTYATCGTRSVFAKATDKDGGISSPASASVHVWEGRFRSPLKEGANNLIQRGQVVPVQIDFGCNGHLSGLSPEIQLLKGDFVSNAGGETSFDSLVTDSVSKADTTGLMREVDSKYIYNLAVPKSSAYPAGTLLTIRVRPFGPGTSPSMYVLLEIRK